jgi:hypothetical protein
MAELLVITFVFMAVKILKDHGGIDLPAIAREKGIALAGMAVKQLKIAARPKLQAKEIHFDKILVSRTFATVNDYN